jgi:hypothetical protein
MSEDVPRLIKRKGDNRCRLDVDDIVALLTRADETDNLSRLPVFVAANPDRLPYMKPEDLDICILARKLLSMESIIKSHDALLSSLNQRVSDNPGAYSSSVFEKSSSTSHVVHTPTPMQVVQNAAVPEGTWADIVAESGLSNDGEFKYVTYKKMKSPPVHRVRFVGVRSLCDTHSGKPVLSVPRSIVAFVGRLQKDTTADELKDYLSDIGILNARCTLLAAKDGRIFKTAAFRVSCDLTYKGLFYNEANWPAGCELRDWVFK